MDVAPGPTNEPAPSGGKKSATEPQKALSEFWDKFISKTPGKITRIFPQNLYSNLLPRRPSAAQTGNVKTTDGYEKAKADCERRFNRIVRECERTNEKWTDPDFDIESDYQQNCLYGLVRPDDEESSPSVDVGTLLNALNTITAVPDLVPTAQAISAERLLAVYNSRSEPPELVTPGAVRRVDWIYDKPVFRVDGVASPDVQQGGDGDCWWVAAVATLCSVPGAVERVCVAQDAKCGVYGFVFHRDGEWVPVLVDDNLYLNKPDFASSEGDLYDPDGSKARRYKQQNQTGSEALTFAKCANANETWLPLLEKAYAKVHGDYAAISGGFPGEGVEDMTGGVTTALDTNKVLEKERLWQELLNVDKEFVFAIAAPRGPGGDMESRGGLAYNHAYSVLEATENEDQEGHGVKLVRVRNPWGKRLWTGEGEWNGPWSDGSKEWTPYWLEKLNYRFGDDGIFWMSYEDMLNRFDQLDRTRLFGDGWHIVQQWASFSVSWITGYIDTKFVVDITKTGPAVYVLSKLDHRYFQGLEGQYDFELNFILQKTGSEPGDHIARARPSRAGSSQRSVSVEVDLKETGQYEVVLKLLATKDNSKPTVEDVVQKSAKSNPQKLRQIGLKYDMAHSMAVSEQSGGSKQVAKKVDPEETANIEKETKVEQSVKDAAKDDPLKETAEKEATNLGESSGTLGVTKDTGVEKSQSATSPVVAEPCKIPEQPTPEPLSGEKQEEKPEGEAEEEDSKIDPWNAVCIVGLRVFSKDSNAMIKLVSPTGSEEGAVLDMDGSSAGATM